MANTRYFVDCFIVSICYKGSVFVWTVYVNTSISFKKTCDLISKQE
ncbi:hypothetical protein HMPREF0645_2047 [Hallella bergensis DSM 17361]|uniref:Uncharacterized protein n=1 Tax=Hallella bergensis DSM 17361 TaxID=585502 RepID=D1PYL2_9BACT|nr:hypothetical protein HMPREF0645_2047 [Hallella bergensis DSM 17361]